MSSPRLIYPGDIAHLQKTAVRKTVISYLKDPGFFPLKMKICSRPEAHSLSGIADWKAGWENYVIGKDGIELAYYSPSPGMLKMTQVPKEIVFHTIEAYLELVHRLHWFQAFEVRIKELFGDHPQAKSMLAERWITLESLSFEDFGRLKSLLTWRRQNPEERFRPRSITAPGVDTKFFEKNHALIRDVFAVEGFSAEIEQEEKLTTFKVSSEIVPALGGMFIRGEISKLHRGPINRILVVENQEILKLYEPPADTLVVFGEGKAAVSVLSRIPFLDEVEILYWGDSDSEGYKILADVRRHFPGVKSVLMGADTVCKSLLFAVAEPKAARVDVPSECLTENERKAFEMLRYEGQRLEQERVPQWPEKLDAILGE